jgi:hypothetical protein
VIAIVLLWAGCHLVVTGVTRAFALDQVEGYAESYLAVQSLPLLVRQALKFASGTGFVCTLAILTWLFRDYRRKRWIIALLLAGETALTLAALGARSQLMLLLAASGILYHLEVRPVRLRTAMLLGSGALAAFLALGIVRSLQGVRGFGERASSLSVGEFEGVFGNALDLERRKAQGEVPPVPTGFFVADVLAPIPSQLLPVTKVDPADWYLETFYPEIKERGGGLVLGVIAQSILGGGPAEVVARGLIVGVFFAALHRLFVRRRGRFWVTAVYLWTLLMAAVSFRATSFYFVSPFVQQVLPTIILVEVIRALIAGAARAQRYVQAGGSPAPTPAGLG